MKRRRKIGFAVVALALIVGCWLWFGPSNEPKYEGLPVSYWFKEYCRRPSNHLEMEDLWRAQEAVQKMGTNAFPYLVGEALNTNQDSAFKVNYYELLGKLPGSWGMPQLVSRDDIRSSAVNAIANIGFSAKNILPLLTKALQETNTLQYKQAISILRYVDTKDAETLVPYFAMALHDADPDVQFNSLWVLYFLGPVAKAAVPDLIEFLGSPQNTNNVLNTVAVLGNIRGAAAPSIPYLKDMFDKETDWWLRSVIACSLCQIDRQQNEALKFLADSLKQKSVPKPSVPISPFTYPSIETHFYDGDSDHLSFAAIQLGLIGSNALPAVPALIEALKDTDAGNELPVIATALKNIGAPADSFLPILKQKLASKDDWIRFGAAAKIIAIVPSDPEAQSILISLIRNRSKLEANALYQLGRSGTNALADTVPALLTVFDESASANWLLAAGASTNIHAPQGLILSKLKEKLKSPDDSVRLFTSRVILDIDPANQDAIANLAGLVKQKSSQMESAIVALAAAGPAAKEAIPALKEALQDKDKDIRIRARSALRKIQSKDGAK